ncbi:MAG: hypothetical protein WAV67_06765, partial [Dokdonella sp.]
SFKRIKRKAVQSKRLATNDLVCVLNVSTLLTQDSNDAVVLIADIFRRHSTWNRQYVRSFSLLNRRRRESATTLRNQQRLLSSSGWLIDIAIKVTMFKNTKPPTMVRCIG